MAIVTGDILWKLSVKTGSAGNSTAQADPNASLGKYISTSAWTGGSLHDLFDAVTGDENAASDVEYRCVFVHNANASAISWVAPKVWISAEVSGGAAMAIGVDPAGATLIGASAAQAADIANEGAAPTGVSFSSPTSKGTGLSLISGAGDLEAGKCVAVWVRRTCANSTAKNNDGATLSVEGDTTE